MTYAEKPLARLFNIFKKPPKESVSKKPEITSLASSKPPRHPLPPLEIILEKITKWAIAIVAFSLSMKELLEILITNLSPLFAS